MTETTPSPSPFASAFKQALPVVMGYVPVGFAYGVLAQKSGLSDANAMAMSLIVFAGSAQLIAVGLFAAAASPLSIVLTTFVVNLRHLLMSAALAPNLKRWTKPQITALTAELTDETFALHATRFSAPGREADPPGEKREIFLINLISQTSWVLGTWLGLVSSSLVADVRPVGLDYALPAMFMALLAGQLKSRMHMLAALLAGFVSVALLTAGVNQWNVMIATVLAAGLAAALGAGVQAWTRKRSS